MNNYKWDIRERIAFYLLAISTICTVLVLLFVWNRYTPRTEHFELLSEPVNPTNLPSPLQTNQNRYKGKKILEIDSYHEDFSWTANITKGVRRVLEPVGVELKVIRMDTKRNSSEEFKTKAALHAKKVIEKFKPDVVIVSDDNACKYLVMPYYREAKIPFVFCGVNNDAKIYGFPYSNVTGQIEISHILQTLDLVKEYAHGNRSGVLMSDTYSEHKDIEYYRDSYGLEFDRLYFVGTYSQWKEAFVRLQGEVDYMIIGTYEGIPDFDKEDAEKFVMENCRIPSGAYGEECMPLALLGVVKDPEELGIWSANTALRILDGTPPSEIPITRNKKGNLMLNMKIAERMGIVFKLPLINKAEIIR